MLCSVHILKHKDAPPNLDEKNDDDDKEVLADPVMAQRRPYVLNVVVYKAQHLVPTHNMLRSSLNPFVSVRFNGNTKQSSVMPHNPNPIWNRRFEMPFLLPLDSDSIEVQIWNKVKGVPDKLIGAATFSYYKKRLTNRPFGPSWVNLYSSEHRSQEVSLLGAVIDKFEAKRQQPDTEYVGRVLVRLSVTSSSQRFPRLRDVTCNPASDPEADEYGLILHLYGASEVPVMGGKACVEVTIGQQRVKSKWVLGHNGVFHWREILEPIFQYLPKDPEQLPDVVINVYHQSGLSQRKMAYERIPAKYLMGRDRSFLLNGAVPVTNEFVRWEPRWRSLQHTNADPNRPHIVAGFLLCTLGFGPRRAMHGMPKNLLNSATARKALKCTIFQAANLPAADDGGSCDAFAVVRFAGREQQLSTVKGTTFPFWNERVHLEADIPIEHPPSVYLMVYHSGLLGHQLLGRCEILASDIMRFPNRLFRFPLYAEERPSLWERKGVTAGENVPYVLASFDLVDAGMRRGGGGGGTSTSGEAGAAGGPQALQKVVLTSKSFESFTVKVENIGLRKILSSTFGGLGNLKLFFDCPMADRNEEVVEVQCGKADGGNAEVMAPAMFDIKLPLNNLHGVPLRVRLCNGSLSSKPIGVVSVPVADFIDGQIERPPYYVASGSRVEEVLDEEGKEDAAEDAAGGAGEEQGDEEGGEDDEDAEDADEEGGEGDAKSEGQTAADAKVEDDRRGGGEEGGGEANTQLLRQLSSQSRDLNAGEEKVAADGASREKFRFPLPLPEKENVLKLDPRSANVGLVLPAYEAAGENKSIMDLLRKVETRKEEEVREEVELRAEYKQEHFVYKELVLRRGRAAGAERLPYDDEIVGAFPSVRAAVLKCFVRVAPQLQVEKEMLSKDDLLRPLKQLYDTDYVIRLYVYRGINLAPNERFFGIERANAYLRVRAGKNEFRSEPIKDELNPRFFQVVELPVHLPDNNDLVIGVHDSRELADELIGATEIDLEWRLLHELHRGPKEYRVLRRPGSSLSHGKLLLRLDILTSEEARRTKPDDHRPEAPIEYELRLVLWQTRNVKFAEAKDADKLVNQKVVVTANFAGEADGEVVKETDTAWEASSGNAEFNYRMKWPVQLPCRVPRVKVALWHESVGFTDTAIGEILLNLQPLFKKALREKQSETKQPPNWFPLRHPNFHDKKLGEVSLEFALVTAIEAEQNPVGEAQREPNVNPFLPDPKRNPPPWAVGTRALDMLQRRRMIAICVCLSLLTLPILFRFVLSKLASAVF